MPIELDMSIEETIEYLERIANNQFECADRIDELHCDSTSIRNMASYHKRLAEWLRELKAYEELDTYNRSSKCSECKHEDSAYYCDDCIWNFVNKFEQKEVNPDECNL